jgi:hypothetical protein
MRHIISIPLRVYVARKKNSHFRHVNYPEEVRNQKNNIFFQNFDYFHTSYIIVWNFCTWKDLKKKGGPHF